MIGHGRQAITAIQGIAQNVAVGPHPGGRHQQLRPAFLDRRMQVGLGHARLDQAVHESTSICTARRPDKSRMKLRVSTGNEVP